MSMNKPRLIPLTDPTEIALFKAAFERNDLGFPQMAIIREQVFADADTLPAWRALQSQSEGGK